MYVQSELTVHKLWFQGELHLFVSTLRLEIRSISRIPAVTVQVCDGGLADSSSVCRQGITLTISFLSLRSPGWMNSV